MTNNTYNWQHMTEIMAIAASAVRDVDRQLRRQWHDSDDEDEMEAISAKREIRYWIIREMDSYPMHPVIEASIKLVRPIDWQQLFLEWPHISQGDRTRIAYTQNEAKGQKNVQTVTSVGKYLNRHFDLPDHTIRDLVARHGSASIYRFVHTTAEMIYHLHRGPGSCMVWREDRGIRCSDGVQRHPYEAYDPKYGWHMAVRIEGDETVGRALCMTSPTDNKKYYVRTYARPSSNGGYSETDNGMENWLTEQGYHKLNYWRDGERLAYHETSDHFLAPYLDGGEKRVTIDVGAKAIVVDSDGEYLCDQTGGCPTDDSGDFFDCEDCGDRTDEDDGYWVNRQEDTRVCESCLNDNYTYVYGRRGNQYYVHNDNVVYVDSQSESYDVDYLDDNEIVELNNGEYAPLDEAVEINGDWFHIEDERICRTEDTDEFLMANDGCWQCEESGNWYTDAVDCVVVDGNKYHPDNAPERIDEDEGMPTMLTMEMLDKVLMIWDYTLPDGMVKISLTYTLDGKVLNAEQLYSYKGLCALDDQTEFTQLVRKELSTKLMAQANDIANAYLASTETQGE
jgi:hypothetical protein